MIKRVLPFVVFSSFLLSVQGCGSQAEQMRFSAMLEANFAYVASPQNGWLAAQSVEIGDEVAAGKTLFVLDREAQVAAVEEAQARVLQKQSVLANLKKGARAEELALIAKQLAEAKAQWHLAQLEQGRWQALAQQELSSQSQKDKADAEFQVTQAKVEALQAQKRIAELPARPDQIAAAEADLAATQAALKTAQWHLAKRQVVAQTTGLVDEVYYRQGEFVKAGTPVISLLLTDSYKVKFYVPQATLAGVHLKQKIRVWVEGIAQPLTARIRFIAKQAEFMPPVLYTQSNRDRLVFLVEAQLNQSTVNLHPGQAVAVDW